MDHEEFWIAALSESLSKPGFYVIVLENQKIRRRIPIIIGTLEAQAIALAMEQMQPVRPQTHDLCHALIGTLGGKLESVTIERVENGVFFAKINLLQDNSRFSLDARPSDALSLSVRADCPILVAKEVALAEAFGLDGASLAKRGSYAEYTLGELEVLLEKIILKEDYESAARLRDAIERRKNNLK